MSPAVEIRRYDGEAIRADTALRARLGEIFVEAFTEPPHHEDPVRAGQWAEGKLVQHAGYPGFRLVAALQAGRVVGFAYGLLGADDQWFTQTLRQRLPAAVAQGWLGGHGELVELAVTSGARGRGLGRLLHDATVEDLRAVGARTALLVVDAEAHAARALYSASGWVHVAEIAPGSHLLGRRFTDPEPG
ncbi:GNAT family N-acetyltransferase [Pseudactinotalea terrae]|uniref:GNAT family N-acetyltransferase n=1 Tax=Pseudactinotalea terrae TaxID=1743262 RepID=UPI0012E0FFA7|nr:GNAT family N-acetyltransferase [Pseudactinotalea terrae]